MAVGVSLEGIASALPKVQPRSRWRMELQSRPDGVLVINDAYNANPDSMRAAIEALAELGRARPGGHTWAVLGDMLELGAMSSAEHANLGASVARHGVSWLIAVGRHAEDVVGAAIDAGLPAGTGGDRKQQAGGHAAGSLTVSPPPTWCWSKPPVA